MQKVFNAYIAYQRNILIEGIRQYPQYFKKSDLVEFDAIINIISEEVKKENLYENWKPIVIYRNPIDYLTVTEEEILTKIFSQSLTGKKLLNEQLDPEVALKDVSAAFKSQIVAIQQLRKYYESLEDQDRQELNDKANDMTKSRKNFIEEIESIEESLNAAFGKLKKGGFLKKLASLGLGKLQGLLARVFGVGEIDRVNVTGARLNEQRKAKYLNEKVGAAELVRTSEDAQKVAAAIRDALAGEKTNLLTTPDISTIASRFGVTPNDVANVAHTMGANVQGTLGTLAPAASTGVKAALGSAGKGIATKAALGSSGKGIAAATTATAAPTGTTATTAAASTAKAVGLGLGAKLAIAAIGLLLVAAGVAGVTVKKRAQRIVQLQKIVDAFGGKVRIPNVLKTSLGASELNKGTFLSLRRAEPAQAEEKPTTGTSPAAPAAAQTRIGIPTLRLVRRPEAAASAPTAAPAEAPAGINLRAPESAPTAAPAATPDMSKFELGPRPARGRAALEESKKLKAKIRKMVLEEIKRNKNFMS